MKAARYIEGQSSSATQENARSKTIDRGRISPGPGMRATVSGNGTTVTQAPTYPARELAQSILAFAQGATSTVVTTDTVIPLSTVENSFEGDADDYLVDLESNVLTLKRPGIYHINYCLTVGYQSPSGTAGLTMREAKVSGVVTLGGTSAPESIGTTTLSSRKNITGLVLDVSGSVELPEMSVDLPGVESTSEGLGAWEGGIAYQETIASTVNAGQSADVSGSEETLDLDLTVTKVPEYASSLFGVSTFPGQIMVRVLYDLTTDSLKIVRGSDFLAPTIQLLGTAVYGGEGDVSPVAVATAVTLSVLRTCPLHATVSSPP